MAPDVGDGAGAGAASELKSVRTPVLALARVSVQHLRRPPALQWCAWRVSGAVLPGRYANASLKNKLEPKWLRTYMSLSHLLRDEKNEEDGSDIKTSFAGIRTRGGHQGFPRP